MFNINHLFLGICYVFSTSLPQSDICCFHYFRLSRQNFSMNGRMKFNVILKLVKRKKCALKRSRHTATDTDQLIDVLLEISFDVTACAYLKTPFGEEKKTVYCIECWFFIYYLHVCQKSAVLI